MRRRGPHRFRHRFGLRRRPSREEEGGEKVALVGNPNVGKSAIFNLLTGRYATVSNYPGTTVEVARGRARWRRGWTIIDTPGINTLTPASEDERVARDILLDGGIRAVVVVADAKNLKRALSLVVQLAELGMPVVLDLNMWDEAVGRGMEIDVGKLSEKLGVPVVPTVAVQGRGVERLKGAIAKASVPKVKVDYGPQIEGAVREVEALLPPGLKGKRGISLMLLSGDRALEERFSRAVSPQAMGAIRAIRERLSKTLAEPLPLLLGLKRLEFAQQLASEVVVERPVRRTALGERLGDLCVHPVWGLPIAGVVLYLAYLVVGKFGAGVAVDFLEGTIFGEFLNPLAERAVRALIPWPLLREFLVGEYGQITMALTYGLGIILPIVATFFAVFSLLEDSGYLPRLAALIHRFLKFLGLSGKAVLPLLLGFGCGTMACITVRILETRKERWIATFLLALGIPCSAQMGVILAMAQGVGGKGLIVWGATVFFVLVVAGTISSRLVKGEPADLLLELPPMRAPTLKNVGIKTLMRVEWYLKEVIPIFLGATALLFLLDKVGLLSGISRVASPLVKGLLGLPPLASQAFLLGFLRRDYGAAGLYQLYRQGMMDGVQVVVSLVTITLFVPCVANFIVIVKERGVKTALAMTALIIPLAFAVGGALNFALRALGVKFP